MRDSADLARMAASQHGLLTIEQLRRVGIGRRRLDRLIDDDLLGRLRRGLYVVAGAAPSWEQAQMAACLSTRPKAVASHRAALRLWGLRTVDDEIEITIRYPQNSRLDGVIVHRSGDLLPADVTYIDGVPVTTPARTICDAGVVLGDRPVSRILDHAVASDLVAEVDLVRFLSRISRQGRHGAGVLRRVLAALPPGAQTGESGPEVDLRRLCREYGLPDPIPQHLVIVRDRRFRPDLAYPEHRIAIEYDGHRVHSDPARFAGDRRRQNLLVLAGWTILRFTADDLGAGRAGTAARIRQALAAAEL